MRPLKIVVPNFPAPDSFTDNVVYSLRAMGHEVRCLDRLSFRDRGRFQRSLADSLAVLYPKAWSLHERWAVQVARQWRPDLVLTLTLALRGEVLAELKTAGVAACVAWWGDPPANMRGMGLLEDGWDRIFIKDPLAARKMRAVGLPAELMHEAANPDWHRPVGAERTKALAVVGNYYGYRQILVRRLIDSGAELALYGFPPPRWSDPRIIAMHRRLYVTRMEKSAIFDGALATLNCTSMAEGDSLNCRAFEVCAAGGLQLIEPKACLADCYEPGFEILTYESVDEILAHLRRASVEPRWADRVRMAGHKRTVADHTYRRRLIRILERSGFSSA